MNKTVLLTGGTGFLGSYLVHDLLKNNYRVIVLKRSISNTWRIDDVFERISCYDIDKTGLEAAFTDQHIDVVIHTACCYGRNDEKASFIADTNLLFGLQVFEFAEDYNVAIFINTGTLLPKHLNYYSLSKVQLSEWLQKVAGKVQIINMKPEHMYGPKDDQRKFIPWVIAQLDRNQKQINLTSGIQERDFVYVTDVVQAYLHVLEYCAELKEYCEFEVGTGQSVAVRKFIYELVRQYKEQHPENQTQLNFGSVPYREGEMMYMMADTRCLTNLGWKAEFSFTEGIKTIIPPPPPPNTEMC
ncbi:NAD-dependent epimerase/dehydratase [Hollandina sp. SP2]